MKLDLDKAISTLVLLFSFGMSIYFGFKGMAAEMGLMIVSGAVFLCFLNIDKFKKFQGAGFSAEMKDTISKAAATTKELEELSIKLDVQLEDLAEEVKKAQRMSMF
ncbi:MAG: hypothetical protein GY820_02530 [Gammaproteobacteria bacterium]|nr:hypothetical protein [Gammaproteobacteria bacterium]